LGMLLQVITFILEWVVWKFYRFLTITTYNFTIQISTGELKSLKKLCGLKKYAGCLM
jgi:hypothetical protein